MEVDVPSKKGGNVGGETLNSKVGFFTEILTCDQPEDNETSGGYDEECEKLDGGDQSVEV